MGGFVTASGELAHREHLREASWLDLVRDKQNIATMGPPIWRWNVPLQTPRLKIVAHVGSARSEQLSQDALVVTEYADRIVLGVADGVTPTLKTPRVDGKDGARFAACTLLEHILDTAPGDALYSTFHTANHDLMSRFGSHALPDLRRRDRPQTAGVAASIDVVDDGTIANVSLVRAADCDVWTRKDGRWSLATMTPMLREETRRELERWVVDNPSADLAQRLEMEQAVITGRGCWNLTALGRFDEPKLRIRDVEPDFDDLVLVTDGPNIRRAVAADLHEPHEWLASLRSWEAANRPKYKRHDDVAMLHLSVVPVINQRGRGT